MDAPAGPARTDKWSAPGSGAAYRDQRFASPRAARRDAALARALLLRSGRARPAQLALDAPCGTGRMRALLESEFGFAYFGLDLSGEMLRGASARRGRSARADLFALPLRAQSVDWVLCCRLLHHLHAPDAIERALAECARVARIGILASFWDAASLPAWRVRAGLKRDEGPQGRRAHARASVEAAFAAAGWRALDYQARPRWLSQQTFVLAVPQH